MEFFAIAEIAADEAMLRREVTIGALPRFCASISEAPVDGGRRGEIDTVWGRFPVTRELIRGGIRFTLPTCPNAFQWTVTAGFPPAPDGVVFHGTINRSDHDPDFIETLRDFAADWKAGLETHFSQKTLGLSSKV